MKQCSYGTTRYFVFALIALSAAIGINGSGVRGADDLMAELRSYPYRIVYETYREGNWELFSIKADGSEPINLTRTPDVHELYPHGSPDGTRIVFVVDETAGGEKIRNVYLMNMDGSDRQRVATNARQPCWDGRGEVIAYLRGESDRFRYTDYATRGLFFYDLRTGEHRAHPNVELRHLYSTCWSPDGRWLVATVHAGMGYRHAIVAIEAEGQRVVNLQIPGCRPDISPDGRRVAWGASDWVLCVGDLAFTDGTPRVVNVRDVVRSEKPMEVYHVDWSPDGKYLAFSRGPAGKRMGRIPEIVGVPATGWNICVADAAATNRWVPLTTDGNCNKEPDWMPVAGSSPVTAPGRPSRSPGTPGRSPAGSEPAGHWHSR
ncbi:MAG TPA: hypothetical protein EYH34_11325 [Planctomycetes bacterium]|nr:hypothetical protein [Planctomycetota bacterium]